MKTEAIVASAGSGRRLKARVSKPYLEIAGKPILIHTLQALNRSPKVHTIIVVVNRRQVPRCARLVERYKVKKVKGVVAGGRERSDSVYNGLKALDPDTQIVLIHDGVRPFVTPDIIGKAVDCAARFGACVVAVPVKATIKKLKAQRSKVKTVESTVDRSNLWEIQTPQVFKKDVIVQAYKRFKNIPATDDAMLVERLGVPVKIVAGSYKNIKITTLDDLVIGEAILKTQISKLKSQNCNSKLKT